MSAYDLNKINIRENAWKKSNCETSRPWCARQQQTENMCTYVWDIKKSAPCMLKKCRGKLVFLRCLLMFVPVVYRSEVQSSYFGFDIANSTSECKRPESTNARQKRTYGQTIFECRNWLCGEYNATMKIGRVTALYLLHPFLSAHNKRGAKRQEIW